MGGVWRAGVWACGIGFGWAVAGCGGAAGPFDAPGEQPAVTLVDEPSIPDDAGTTSSGGTTSGGNASAVVVPNPPGQSARVPAANAEVARGTLERRCGAGISLLQDGQVLVTGGLDPQWSKTKYATAERFDPATGEWTWVAPMLHDRGGHLQVTLPDGKVLVAGGHDTIAYPSGRQLELTEWFDPATGVWTQLGDLPEPMSSVSGLVFANGDVLAVSGLAGAHFDRASKTWHRVDPTEVPGALRLLEDGRVLTLSRQGRSSLYDPVTRTWQSLTPAPAPPYVKVADFLSDSSNAIGAVMDDRLLEFDAHTLLWTERGTLDAPPRWSGVRTRGGLLSVERDWDADAQSYLLGGQFIPADGSEATQLAAAETGACGGNYGIELRDGRVLLPGHTGSTLLTLPR